MRGDLWQRDEIASSSFDSLPPVVRSELLAMTEEGVTDECISMDCDRYQWPLPGGRGSVKLIGSREWDRISGTEQEGRKFRTDKLPAPKRGSIM
jgi:hypothetical protein